MRAPELDAAHWRMTRNLAIGVLVVWSIAALGVYWAVLPLGAQEAGGAAGVPMGYWYAAQGALILFVLLAFYANWRQDGIDRTYGERD